MNWLELLDPDTLRVAKRLNLGAPVPLTLVNNALEINRSHHEVTSMGNVPQRRLNTLSGGAAWDIVLLRLAAGSQTMTLRDGVDNLRLAGDCTLGAPEDVVCLFSLGLIWVELFRSINT